MSDNDPPTVGAIGKAKCYMKIVASENIKRSAKGFVTSKFRKSASSLFDILSVVNEKKSCPEKTAMLQRLKQHIIKYETINIFCKVCVEILVTPDKSQESVIRKMDLNNICIMLHFLANSSHDTSEICSAISEQPRFLEVLTKRLVDWTETPLMQTSDQKYPKMLEFVCTILHNVAMFEANVEKVRSVGCIEAMKHYLDYEDKTIRLTFLATLADLVNESESEILKSKGDVIKFLMETISAAMEAEEKSYNGWSLKELARIVRQVARNDNNKRTVVQHGAIPIFIKMAKCDNIEEQREAVRVIWTLSFDQENRSQMVDKMDWAVKETLEKLTQSPDDVVRDISKRVLWTMQERVHIMISYNWEHQSMVKQISENLRSNGIKVWMDVDDMYGSTLEAMASAIEKADIFLMCYSSKYKDSNNCHSEAEYAFKLNKNIIPLKMEGNYKPDGWLGFIIGAKLYYDFSGKYPFENKIKDLLREIHRVRNEPISETIIPVMSSATTTTNTQKQTKDSVRKWKPAKVKRWLNGNNLPKKLSGRLRGKDVAFLYLLVHESPNRFYQTIKCQLGVKDLQTMTNLRFALDDLDMDTNTS